MRHSLPSPNSPSSLSLSLSFNDHWYARQGGYDLFSGYRQLHIFLYNPEFFSLKKTI